MRASASSDHPKSRVGQTIQPDVTRIAQTPRASAASSAIGWVQGIFAPQRLHFPPSAIQLANGISSSGRRTPRQLSHRDRAITIRRPEGTRVARDSAKLPMAGAIKSIIKVLTCKNAYLLTRPTQPAGG